MICAVEAGLPLRHSCLEQFRLFFLGITFVMKEHADCVAAGAMDRH